MYKYCNDRCSSQFYIFPVGTCDMLPNIFENCIPTSPWMGSQEKTNIETVEHGLKWLEYSCRIKPLELNPMLEEGYHPVDSGSKFIRIISHKGCFHGGDIDDAMQ